MWGKEVYKEKLACSDCIVTINLNASVELFVIICSIGVIIHMKFGKESVDRNKFNTMSSDKYFTYWLLNNSKQ